MKKGKIDKMIWMNVELDCNLQVVNVSDPNNRLFFGVELNEFLGKSMEFLLTKTDESNCKQAGLIVDSLCRAVREERNVYLEYISTLPYGDTAHVTAHVRYTDESVIYLYAAEIDDDDIRRSQEIDLAAPIDRESHMLLRMIHENLPVGLELYDRQGKLIEINRKDMEMLGIRKKNDVLGLNIFDNPNIPGDMKKLLHMGEDIRFIVEYDFEKARENYYKTEFSGAHNFEVSISVIRDKKSSIDKYLLIAQDITDRTLLQNKYQTLYNRNQIVLEALPVGVELYDTDGNLMFMNNADCEIFGIDKEFHVKNKINIYENPNLPDEVKAAVRNGTKIHTRFSYSFDLVDKSGYYETNRQKQVSRIDCNGNPVMNANGQLESYVFIVTDVTEAVMMEEALRQSKQKTELSMKAADIMLWEFNTDTKLFVSENDPVNDYDNAKQVTIKNYSDRIHPEDREQAKTTLFEMLSGKDKPFSLDVRMMLPDHKGWQYCTVSGSPYEKNADGRVIRFVGFRKNNTELKRRKLLQEKILNDIPLPIHIKDVADDFRYVFCNKESERVFGTSEGQTVFAIMDEFQAERMHKTDKEVFATGEPYFGKEQIVLKDGRTYEMIVQKSVIYDGDRRLLLNVRWDQSLQNDLMRRAKVLSISMEAMNAYTWFYEPEKNQVSFGEGFDKVARNPAEVDSLEKFSVCIHPDDRHCFTDSMYKLLEDNSGEWAIEYRADLNGDGVYEWWETRGVLETTVFNDTPYRYIIGMSVCIEAHKQTELTLIKNREVLHQMVRQNELVLNNTNSGLAYIDTNYVVQWENVSMCSASLSYEAYKKGEYCYKSAHNRTTPCENCVMQRAMNSQQMEKIKFCLENNRTVEIFATPVFNEINEIDGIVIRVDDITDHERMIEELRKAKLHAEESDKLKSAFLANMSHEIRTPLNAIVGFSDLLMSSEDDTDKKEYMQIINTNNEVLLRLINDILDLSKIEAGSVELKYEEFDLSEYFDNMVSSMRQRITNPNIRLIADNPYASCRVKLDKNRIVQVMTNYVTNAIKYTPKGFIEMGYELVDVGIRLYVKDSGIGISEDKKNKVFHRFEKLDEFAQGTGLGLSICKAIAESMGGSVGFESAFGEGSLFWAVMPCDPETETGEKYSGEESFTDEDSYIVTNQNNGVSALNHKTILVAEDIASNYLLISAILRKQYNLLHANNGKEAVEMVKKYHADLLLMDMKMPEMDGLTATAEIRKFNTELPIVALTAHAFESDRIAALQAGCNEYLVKPIDKARLMAVLRKYCPGHPSGD